MRELTTTDFDETLASVDDLVVDFWAPWCGPCHALAPELERLAAAHPGLQVMKVNIDEQPELATRYGVMSIPTVLRFQGGAPVAHTVGATSADQLAQRLGIG